MSRLFDDAASEYFISSTGIITAAPLTMACFVFKNDAAVNIQTHTLSQAAQKRDYFQLQFEPSGTISAAAHDGSFGEAASTTQASLNVWNHIAGVFYNDSLRSVFLNGGSKGTNADIVAPAAIDTVAVGARFIESVPSLFVSGRLAEVGFWNVALTDAEILSLSSGFPPSRIRPQNLVAYYPLHAQTGDAKDFSGNGNHLTDINTVGIADHAPSPPGFGFDSPITTMLATGTISTQGSIAALSILNATARLASGGRVGIKSNSVLSGGPLALFGGRGQTTAASNLVASMGAILKGRGLMSGDTRLKALVQIMLGAQAAISTKSSTSGILGGIQSGQAALSAFSTVSGTSGVILGGIGTSFTDSDLSAISKTLLSASGRAESLTITTAAGSFGLILVNGAGALEALTVAIGSGSLHLSTQAILIAKADIDAVVSGILGGTIQVSATAKASGFAGKMHNAIAEALGLSRISGISKTLLSSKASALASVIAKGVGLFDILFLSGIGTLEVASSVIGAGGLLLSTKSTVMAKVDLQAVVSKLAGGMAEAKGFSILTGAGGTFLIGSGLMAAITDMAAAGALNIDEIINIIAIQAKFTQEKPVTVRFTQARPVTVKF